MVLSHILRNLSLSYVNSISYGWMIHENIPIIQVSFSFGSGGVKCTPSILYGKRNGEIRLNRQRRGTDMNSKSTLFVIALATVITIVSGAAHAGSHRHSYEDKARVLRVKPIYDSVSKPVTERRCREDYRRTEYHDHDSMTGTIAGGIIGGVVGNQFGRGNGKTVMTIAGTLLGGSIGNDVSRNRHRVYDSGPRCEEVTHYRDSEELVGYRVKYRYHGQTYWTRTERHPGDYLQVRVSVRPIE